MAAELDERSDEALMQAYRAGDAAAFDALFARYRAPLFTYLRHLGGSQAVAEDLFQEVFLRVIRGRDAYQPSGSFRSWLFTIAHNATTDERRRSTRREVSKMDGTMRTADPNADDPRPWEPPSPDRATDPAARSHARELRQRIEAALLRLPRDQREVFLLRERAGLDFQNIARVTESELAATKSRMRYALAGLRRLLSNELASITEGSHE